MTLAVLQGPDGPQRKELEKLVAGLRSLKPDLVYVPNLMFVGLANRLKRALDLPILCGLTGEGYLPGSPAGAVSGAGV